MAVPKRKVSGARRDSRRASVSKLDSPALEMCRCGQYKLRGRVCPVCGTYNNTVVIEPEAKK